MSLPTALQSVADASLALLDAFEAGIHSAQLGYLAAYGRFCQLPSPVDGVPIHGALTTCDWSRYVDDVRFAWDASPLADDLPSQLPCSVRYNVCSAASGHTYTAVIKIADDDHIYWYRRTYGADGLIETKDWEVMPDVF